MGVITYTDRGDGAYTMYLHGVPVAVIVKVDPTWHGLVIGDRDGDYHWVGDTRESVATAIAAEIEGAGR